MKRILACLVALAFCSVPAASPSQHPIPPGVREADKLPSPTSGLPPAPPTLRSADPAELHRQAAELARLAGGVPSAMDQVEKGVLPKDLKGNLQRIEKLSKQIRHELAL